MLELQFFILHFTALADFHAFGVEMYVNEHIEYKFPHSFHVFIISMTNLPNVKQEHQPSIKMRFICSPLMKIRIVVAFIFEYSGYEYVR